MKVYWRINYKEPPEFLFETDKEINPLNIIKYKGNYYSVCNKYDLISEKPEVIEVEWLKSFTECGEKITDRTNEYDGNVDIICPVCGTHIDEYPEDFVHIDCPYCGAHLNIFVEHIVTYSPIVESRPKITKIEE